ncbi:ornithine decarboxylase antizyme-domain-containing protein [Amanita rubescens]|nr:ornithine decarboxylase antizyme-domain-containing protein [Amanita rubescens]
MGLLFSTTIPMYLLSANFRGQAIYITILPRFREDLGGAFDVPKEKCPPDGGSSGCVTGNPMSIFPSSKKPIPTSLPHSSCDPLFKSTTQRSQSDYFIFQRRHSRSISSPNASSDSDISTPSLTPDSNNCRQSPVPTSSVVKPSSDALDFLMTLFPRHGLIALPYAKRMSISAPNLGVVFDGVVLDLPEEPRTLYVDGKSAESVNLRESIIALLDLADERLGCSGLAIALERSSPNLGALLHSLMYVGGSVVTRPPFDVDSAFILVGLDI